MVNVVGPVGGGVQVQLVWGGATGTTTYIYRKDGSCSSDLNQYSLKQTLNGGQTTAYDTIPSGTKVTYKIISKTTCRGSVYVVGQSSCMEVTASGPVYGTGAGTAYYYLTDHLGTVRAILDSNGTILSTHDYEPYGVELLPAGADDTEMNYRYTGQERDRKTNLDYFHARFFTSSMGRFTRPDPVQGKTIDVQSWNLYSYVRGNPVNMIDPLGLDWYRIDGKWQWRTSHGKIKWTDSKGKTHTAKGYTHLLVVKPTKEKGKDGVTYYKVELYKQNEKTPVATGKAFSGGAEGAGAVPSGNYFILNRRDPPPTKVESKDPNKNPPVVYGIQDISRAALPSDDPSDPNEYDVWSAYGPTRAYLNPIGDPTGRKGFYYHGQQSTRGVHHGTTHGCLSYGQDDTVMRAIIKTGSDVGVSIDTQVETPW